MSDGAGPLRAILAAAGLPTTGRYAEKAGWVSRAWIGDEYVVRLGNGRGDAQVGGAYRHEAAVVALLDGSDVPHARHVAHGDGETDGADRADRAGDPDGPGSPGSPDGPWYVSERLPGHTLFDAWPQADLPTRRSMIESLGTALRALHRVPVPPDLMPPWLTGALAGGPWPAYHPPVVDATLQQVESARRRKHHDPRLLTDVAVWVEERLPLFADDTLVLVHGDLHGSNVIVDEGRVTGIIDFAEAVAQPADAELDTILRWCARAGEFPPTPADQGLDPDTLAEVPGWLRGAYPELFERPHLRERLRFYDMYVELAIHAHHPEAAERDAAQRRIVRLLAGHDHLDALSW